MTSTAAPTATLPALPAGDALLKLKGAAQLLGVSPLTVRRWCAQGLLEQPVRLNRKPYFKLSQLQAFIAAQRPAAPTPKGRPAA